MDNDSNDPMLRTEDKDNSGYRKIIIIAIIVCLVVVLGLIIYYVSSKQTAAHDIKEFKGDILNKRYSKISKTLSINGNEFTKGEAKLLSNYIVNVKGKDAFEKEINQINKRIKNEEDYNITDGYGSITDLKGRKILDVTKDGKKLFFFDKVLIKPRYINVYLPKDKQEPTYRYKYNSKTKVNKTNQSKATDLGEFIVGSYKLESEKEYTSGVIKGKSKGYIDINTDKYDKDEKVIAKPQYKEVSFKPMLENADKLESESLKIHINDSEQKYSEGKIYGNFPTSESISVYASGRISDDVFKTNDTTIDLMSDNEEQKLTLKFKKSEIKDKIKAQSKIKDKAKEFMKAYTKDLTSGYTNIEFKKVDKYFIKGSELSNHIESMINSKKKTKYKNPNITDVNLKGDKVTLKLSKMDNKNNNIKSKYELEYNDEKDTFKIINYTDI